MPKEILKQVSEHYGVFTRCRVCGKKTILLPDIPLFVDGSDEETIILLDKLAHSISGEK
ncbi:MAG: hypothetical protein WDO19_00810 [Bacteroidota bacterium]